MVPDPRAWLEARLGSLAEFEAEPPPQPEPEPPQDEGESYGPPWRPPADQYPADRPWPPQIPFRMIVEDIYSLNGIETQSISHLFQPKPSPWRSLLLEETAN